MFVYTAPVPLQWQRRKQETLMAINCKKHAILAKVSTKESNQGATRVARTGPPRKEEVQREQGANAHSSIELAELAEELIPIIYLLRCWEVHLQEEDGKCEMCPATNYDVCL